MPIRETLFILSLTALYVCVHAQQQAFIMGVYPVPLENSFMGIFHSRSNIIFTLLTYVLEWSRRSNCPIRCQKRQQHTPTRIVPHMGRSFVWCPGP